MKPAHILLVDDDALLRRSLAFSLQQAGHRPSTAATAEEALALAARDRPDLVLLDIGLPGMDGLEALRQFQARLDVPVIFLTARRREFDQVLGLELGAEDYVTKPFDEDVLLARIKVALRRHPGGPAPNGAGESPLVVGDLLIDPAAHRVELKGHPVELPPLEFKLLLTLARDPGRVFSTDDLLNQVWGPEYVGESQVVYVHVRWLREEIEEDPHNPRRILTVRGVGYKLMPSEAG